MARRTPSKAKAPRERTLSARYRLFAHRYVELHHNGTEAAKQAGFSEASAHVTACRLLKNPKVKALVDELDAKLLARVDSSAESVLRELRLVASARLADIMDGEGRMLPPKEWPEAAKAGVQKVKQKVLKSLGGDPETGEPAAEILALEYGIGGKDAALRTLAEHHGLLKQEVQVTGDITIRLKDPYASPKGKVLGPDGEVDRS